MFNDQPVYTGKTTKAKAWVAALGSLLMALSVAFADDVVSVGETGTVVTVLIEAALTVFAVYRVPNNPVE